MWALFIIYCIHVDPCNNRLTTNFIIKSRKTHIRACSISIRKFCRCTKQLQETVYAIWCIQNNTSNNIRSFFTSSLQLYRLPVLDAYQDFMTKFDLQIIMTVDLVFSTSDSVQYITSTGVELIPKRLIY